MDLQRVRGLAMVLGVLVIGPLFGTFVDLLYLTILLLSLGRLRWSHGVLLASAASLGFAALLALANPVVHAPFFSYFFARLALLLLLFGGMPMLWKEPDPRLLYALFAVYVVAIVYQYLALPGADALQGLHAEKIVEEGVGYRASGLFSGFFSAATVIGSLGIVLLMRSGVWAAFLVGLGMLAVAFCSGRSIVVYLGVGLVMLAWRAPRVAVAVGALLAGLLMLALLQLAAVASESGDVAESLVLFLQIWSVLSGDVSGTSTEALLRDQYYLPTDLGVLLFGNNERPFTAMGVGSDSGYMQLLFGMGLIGGIAYLAILTGFLLRRATPTALALLAAMVLVSFKGNAFIAVGVLDFLFLFAGPSVARGMLTRRRDLAAPEAGGGPPVLALSVGAQRSLRSLAAHHRKEGKP